MSSKKIESLQALRALAFLGIFLLHAANFLAPVAKLGVSIFYVMSGFLMMYTYEKKDMEASFIANLKFSINKIKKLYPLHIITMLLMVILSLIIIIMGGDGIRSYVVLFGTILLNVLLLQTWIPNSTINTSLNGVAWYLSVTLFLYFMFPYILKWIKNKRNSILIIVCVLILALQILSSLIFIHFFGEDSPIYVWYVYCFPVFRLGDFFIGCCLKRISEALYLYNARKYSIYISAIEAVILFITVITLLWLDSNQFDNILMKAICNWTTIYIPFAVIWVYLFTVNEGILTKLFNNSLLRFIGDISAYIFLIHYVIVMYVNWIVAYFAIDLTGWKKIVAVILELALSVGVSVVYRRMERTVRTR